ncbi:MetS family NSS transporter small subunit [Microbacterium sp. C7(2022)]|uniref:MetS family NSS transporter small subunit n=1 Tax=Microbacterium sp. C7(2022) TaxID=2992759 RepID=UPI00237C10BB|nr:MetS family NSS transporter small subunit [Microbacterium sp. C7(2022)]MDE0545792.1 MetS family NSS transporter small subunit [Microbacterium sp. C7(2022)]
MTAIAVVFLLLALVVVWGGLFASILFVRARPETAEYPPGGADDHREDDAPVERDT